MFFTFSHNFAQKVSFRILSPLQPLLVFHDLGPVDLFDQLSVAAELAQTHHHRLEIVITILEKEIGSPVLVVSLETYKDVGVVLHQLPPPMIPANDVSSLLVEDPVAEPLLLGQLDVPHKHDLLGQLDEQAAVRLLVRLAPTEAYRLQQHLESFKTTWVSVLARSDDVLLEYPHLLLASVHPKVEEVCQTPKLHQVVLDGGPSDDPLAQCVQLQRCLVALAQVVLHHVALVQHHPEPLGLEQRAT